MSKLLKNKLKWGRTKNPKDRDVRREGKNPYSAEAKLISYRFKKFWNWA